MSGVEKTPHSPQQISDSDQISHHYQRRLETQHPESSSLTVTETFRLIRPTTHLNMATKAKLSPDHITQLNALLQPANHVLVTAASDPEKYQSSISRWSTAAIKEAGAVLVPESVEAVQIAVKFAAANNIDLAVRGGGHSTSGASSTDSGLLIDLGRSSKFTQVTVDKTKRHIIAGGGANWGQVDDAGFAAGLATVGGTVADTGVGGLTLGGGYGFLSGKLGLTIDNLVSVTLVTADGEARVVDNDGQDKDLFWAVRGAGHNFGVAVQFVLQGHVYGTGPVEERAAGGAEGGQAFAGMLIFSPDKLDAIIPVINKLHGAGGSLGPAAAGGFAFARPPPAGGAVVIICPVIWHGDEASGRKAFQELISLGPIVEDIKMMDYPGINRLFQFAPQIRASLKGLTFNLPLRNEFAHQVLDSYTKFTEELPDASDSLVFFELYDPTVVDAKATNTDMAFCNRGYHFNGLASSVWQKEENDQACRVWGREVAALFQLELEQNKGTKTAARNNTDAVMMYSNYERESLLLVEDVGCILTNG